MQMFYFVFLDETDEEDVQARKRRMAEKAATGILEDAEVRIFQPFRMKVSYNNYELYFR